MRPSMALGSLAASLAAAHPTTTPRGAQVPYFITTGDSTTAINGGWGDGFLALAQNGASGINHAKSGATTVSFRADGRWDATLASIAETVADYEPIVTIQFGHNDQKPEKGISLEQFQANLEQLATEVIEAGGTPVSHHRTTTPSYYLNTQG